MQVKVLCKLKSLLFSKGKQEEITAAQSHSSGFYGLVGFFLRVALYIHIMQLCVSGTNARLGTERIHPDILPCLKAQWRIIQSGEAILKSRENGNDHV